MMLVEMVMVSFLGADSGIVTLHRTIVIIEVADHLLMSLMMELLSLILMVPLLG